MNKRRIVFLLTSCKKTGPVQQTLNIIKHLDRDVFEPHLLTLYPEEDEGSQLSFYLPYVPHHYIPTGKLSMLTGRDKALRQTLEVIQPDVIHSQGVFPDYAVCRMKRWRQVVTLRNYVYEDYPSKFGRLQGNLLVRLHLYAMSHTAKTVTCSESLAKIYKERLGRNYDFIRNGVDVEKYTRPTEEERMGIREELNLPKDTFIYVYTGQMIERKNVDFLLKCFTEHFNDNKSYLLLLGGGPLLDGLKEKYRGAANVDFRGSVNNVNHYLKACDAYVSSSLSEGLPNGVLEAMATGLPVVLSDIMQHQEIFDADNGIGYLYNQGNESDLANKMKQVQPHHEAMSKAAYLSAHENFSAQRMSRQYQEIYKEVMGI